MALSYEAMELLTTCACDLVTRARLSHSATRQLHGNPSACSRRGLFPRTGWLISDCIIGERWFNKPSFVYWIMQIRNAIGLLRDVCVLRHPSLNTDKN